MRALIPQAQDATRKNGHIRQTLSSRAPEPRLKPPNLLQNHLQNDCDPCEQSRASITPESDGVVAKKAPLCFSEIVTLLEQIDEGRREISRQFIALDKRFGEGLVHPTRFVLHVKTRFPDGSPSRVYFSLTFHSRTQVGEGFRSVDADEMWVRPYTKRLTRANLHREGELENADILIASRQELDLLTQAMKGLNRAALSVRNLLRCHSAPPANERTVPRMPRCLGRPRLFAFRQEVIGMAWSFANRIARIHDDLHSLVHDHNSNRPDPRASLFCSEDKEHPWGRFRWRIRPGNKRPTHLTDRLLRSLGIPERQRRLLCEFERERRRLDAKHQRFWRILRRMKTKSRAARKRAEAALFKVKSMLHPAQELRELPP